MSEAHELPDDDLDNGGAEQAALEARARTMGWKPLSEYRGPPGKWTDAAEFIRKGEENLPVLRDNNRRMSERIARLDNEIAGLRNTADETRQIIADLRAMNQRADQRGYDRAMAELEAKKRTAVAAGDTETYDALVNEAERMTAERKAAAPAPAPKADAPPAQPQLDEDTKAFIAANRWFSTNKALADRMIDLHQAVMAEMPGMSIADQLEEAKSRLVEEQPEKFGANRQQRQPAPEPEPDEPPAPRRARQPASPMPPSGGTGGNRPQAAVTNSINSIADPEERSQARAAFKRMQRQFPDYTEAEYMEVYTDPHADILATKKGKSK